MRQKSRLLLLLLLLHIHRRSSLPHKTRTHLPGGGIGVVRSFAHRKRRKKKKKKKKKKKRLFRGGSTKRRDAQRRALFSCRVIFDTESRSESPEIFDS